MRTRRKGYQTFKTVWHKGEKRGFSPGCGDTVWGEAAGIQTCSRRRTNFLPADASVSSSPAPSCWNTPGLLWRCLGAEGLPGPAPPAPGTPASACGAPARTARPDSPPGAPWSDCAPQSQGRRTHGACPRESRPRLHDERNYFPCSVFLFPLIGPDLRGHSRAIKGHAASHSLW